MGGVFSVHCLLALPPFNSHTVDILSLSAFLRLGLWDTFGDKITARRSVLCHLGPLSQSGARAVTQSRRILRLYIPYRAPLRYFTISRDHYHHRQKPHFDFVLFAIRLKSAVMQSNTATFLVRRQASAAQPSRGCILVSGLHVYLNAHA